MKRMRRFFSIMLAMMMVLGMGLTALADDSYTITVKQNKDDKAEHTYEAYQIFSGVLAPNPDYGKEGAEHSDVQYILSDIDWGTGVVDSDGLLAALQADEEIGADFKDCTTAASVAKVLSDSYSSTSVGDSGKLDTFASIVSEFATGAHVDGTATAPADAVITVTGVGYYLVKDANNSLDNEEEAAYTRNLLEVVGNSTMVVKSEVPSGDKKVFYTGLDAYNNPDHHENYVGAADSNYAGIGDHVTYQITSKVPNYTGYDYYYFVMSDTMTAGLTFDGAAHVTVKVGDATLEEGSFGADGNPVTDDEGEVVGDYFVYPNGDHSFKLAFVDIMNYDIGANIVVTYSATVNEDAIIGVAGNENAWSLEYSQNPNVEYDGTKDDSKPGLPLDEENTPLGKTPEQKTLTYLTEIDITKYANEVDLTDLTKNLLAGAEFTLTGTSYQIVQNQVTYYAEDENGTYYKLLDGTYTTTVPTTEDTYVAVGDGTEDTTKGYLKNETDNTYYVPADVTEYNGKTVYKLQEGSASLYADANVTYIEKTATDITRVPSDVSIKLTTGEDGKISFKGLGEGEYTLTETVTPEGFNTIEPITFNITFKSPGALTNSEVSTGNEVCEWEITGWTKDENGNQTIANNGGIFSANIINVGGALLPSTGGIGTTIFYVVGGALVFVAVVLLVARKRMSKEQ
ncbi:MAG: isopeptide-forming domain-containing fimbrial protein [Roseburia sp.]|nr:isopeptide-forming domain-containing fimbrial protein [Roseburia sp.]MCM1097470.1 isopeptide-forming domain-containing fimbrial protein [Ruminococcus flavefaciens]